MPPQVRAFVHAHCLRCHGTATKEGGLDLQTLAGDLAIPAAFETWVKVHDKVHSGAMPPKDDDERPTPAATEALLKTLNAELTRADLARRAGDGRATFRRLNRTEYENTLPRLARSTRVARPRNAAGRWSRLRLRQVG